MSPFIYLWIAVRYRREIRLGWMRGKARWFVGQIYALEAKYGRDRLMRGVAYWEPRP